jgi:DNA invertase Pin-like site-specific DNA recombinase
MPKPKAYSYLRFSTPEQCMGDSERRQIKTAEKWGNDHGVELDNSLKFKDRGVSAYRGLQREKGDLGQFLGLIKKGIIPRNSYLIVESLDRLSREKVFDALKQFIDIINGGIQVVTLTDGMIYSEKTVTDNFSQLMTTLVIMSRAYDESRTKSIRLSATWDEKRKEINKKKLTSRCPAWLELNEDRTVFLCIKERCEVIEQIFRMKSVGKGAARIERELNEKEGIWKPKNGWRKSYINKILRYRAVIGEFQPHKKMSDGKRKPVDDPIPDYFPEVISNKLFYEVQNSIKMNVHYGGKTGKAHNLFAHIAKCGLCSAPIHPFLTKLCFH